jgi:hypothetical protein
LRREYYEQTYLIEFQGQDLITSLTNLNKIGHGTRVSRGFEAVSLLLSTVQGILVFGLGSVTDDDAVRNRKGPIVLPPLLPGKITHFWYALPLLVSDNGQTTFQVSKLVLNLGALSSVLNKFCVLFRLPG